MPEPKPAAERLLERGLFAARWLMAPFYVGLMLALIALLVAFVGEIVHAAPHLLEMTPEHVILLSLSLIDLSLAGNLLLVVTFSGYENFVSPMDVARDGWPSWMGKVDFSGLKLKLIASIVAIAAISLLRAFMQLAEGDPVDPVRLSWMAALLATLVVAGVLLALMDWLNAKTDKH